MRRRTLSTAERVRIFESANGNCHLCSQPIHVSEKWEADHVIPRAVTGRDDLGAFSPAHAKCHRVKSSEVDIPQIAKTKRIRAKHIGAHRTRNPMAGSKASGWQKRMDGTVIRRA